MKLPNWGHGTVPRIRKQTHIVGLSSMVAHGSLYNSFACSISDGHTPIFLPYPCQTCAWSSHYSKVQDNKAEFDVLLCSAKSSTLFEQHWLWGRLIWQCLDAEQYESAECSWTPSEGKQFLLDSEQMYAIEKTMIEKATKLIGKSSVKLWLIE